MLTVTEAEQTIARRAPRYPTERIPVARAAGRVLRETVRADRELPPFDRATMDGIAIRFVAWQAGMRSFRVEATAPAGQPPQTLHDPGACVRIMTGAVVPQGCDTVIPFEDLEIDPAKVSARADARVERGQHIHLRGTDRRQGDPVLAPGCILRAPQIAILAALSHAEVEVGRQPSVSILSLGDELIPLDQPLAAYQIRPANGYGLEAALRARGWTDVRQRLVRDNLDELSAALAAAIPDSDLVLLSGGVSKGDYDFVPAALQRLGVEHILHGVSQRPGKPLWFGRGSGHQMVFGLPGNPVSTLVCFHRYVLPQLYQSMGAPPPQPAFVQLAVALTPLPRLTLFAPVRLQAHAPGLPEAVPLAYHGSGDYSALGESHGFIELERGSPIVPAGSVVRYHAWADPYVESHQP